MLGFIHSPKSNKTSWFTLSEIVDSALADVIKQDANFQLKQSQAWNQFSQSFRELSNNPMIQTLDFTVGFGRLENLAINQLSIDLALDIYKPNFIVRRWWGILKLVGRYPNKEIENMYRLSTKNPGAKNRIEFSIQVSRDQFGNWKTEHAPDENTLQNLTKKIS